ncbi:DUF72 domain-containing protein [Catellatospora coxensis]|uniref:Histidine kinase n=1 Tax=Catellatospora coxensis TaxID=310354 RepID=A0A8J3KRY3_9ACTN|nr:DUF72 domain-containing protein [Catellatospora coxensis]GIG05017.1 histidine kinase [Catellatospora coxensis]
MILVGTSGWQYADWRGPFYPPGLPQRLWLRHYAEHFPTVEVNSVFYRLPPRDTFTAWRDQLPEDFVMAVKMSRYLTHIKRLRDPQEPVDRFLGVTAALADHLGPVLLQLPPTLRADPEALSAVLRCFPPHIRVAVEPRHRSWWTDETRAVLEHHHAALAWADRLGRPVTPLWRTTDFAYLRLHEGRANPRPRYGPTALTTWHTRLATTFPAATAAYVYFNNDPHAAAIADAAAFTTRMKGRASSAGAS